MQTDTMLAPSVPASMTDSQDHCSRQSPVSIQSTKQIQPLPNSAHDAPEGQLFEPPQDKVQTFPGNALPDWQSLCSQSLLLMQGPPTSALSFPAVPAGRPSSPHPEPRNSTSKIARRA